MLYEPTDGNPIWRVRPETAEAPPTSVPAQDAAPVPSAADDVFGAAVPDDLWDGFE
ncbi:hypothetical protein [Streptomyces sp. GC420]|uniref:hypothetical protein n=1 Tax=Streptomyces sp. GC420 TaxID=2697568 RepID=UPI001414E16C|nr:hypothetical protein [Streptomyces sp. GC420]NBM19896.1 hypothetical protein [Streptomyces sp. GC420]